MTWLVLLLILFIGFLVYKSLNKRISILEKKTAPKYRDGLEIFDEVIAKGDKN